MLIIREDQRNISLQKHGIVEKLIPSKDGVVSAVGLRSAKSYLERAVQHLYPLELQCDRKNNPASVEKQLYKINTTSCSKQTAAVIADIAIKDQFTDENDTLQE